MRKNCAGTLDHALFQCRFAILFSVIWNIARSVTVQTVLTNARCF